MRTANLKFFCIVRREIGEDKEKLFRSSLFQSICTWSFVLDPMWMNSYGFQLVLTSKVMNSRLNLSQKEQENEFDFSDYLQAWITSKQTK